jgi:hypothetical protein
MGYLNNDTIVLDAILTKKGRELMARNDGSFKITQFALSDDEIDYTLFNPEHPSGSAFFGEAIENMPILEAFPDENQIMKYKLISLPRGTAKIPIINTGYNSITLQQGQSLSISPQTLNYLGTNSTFESSGYVFNVGDSRLLSNFEGLGIDTPDIAATNNQTSLGTSVSRAVIGTTLNITGTNVNTLFGSNTSISSILTITGRDSGARITIPININKVNN